MKLRFSMALLTIATAFTSAAEPHWAFQPMKPVQPPPTADESNVVSPIDRFLRSPLEAKGLEPNPPANAETLIRRMYFDVIGLPPTQEALDTFIAAAKQDRESAIADLIDQLLASPHYGERWGRHWLDLARYADSSGFHDDLNRPDAWRYRDYVIKSLNEDKPYGQFIREQLAGDEIDPENHELLTATGFCRNGPSNANNVKEPFKEQYRLDQLDDVLATTTTVFLGLNVGCARCHDHKTDPIPQSDYYRMLAIFNTGEKKDIPLDDKKKGPKIMAFMDGSAKPRATHVLHRGNPAFQRDQVEPGVPGVLAHVPIFFEPPSESAKTTGRRRALAHWIAAPENPMTWRVMANRVWQHYFSEGLVRTPSNFGTNGSRPSHPELLDWLAGELVRADGSLKHLHRTILSSAAYQRSSAYHAGNASIDSENTWLWRMSKKPIEAEIIRDRILAASGTLNLETGGPGIKPHIAADLLTTSKRNTWPKVTRETEKHWRRSVYVYVKRQLLMPMLELFDQPTASVTCGKRTRSVTPTQSLALMNNRFVNEQAGFFADRVLAASEDPEEQIDFALRTAWSRRPSDEQAFDARRFLETRLNYDNPKNAFADLAVVLFNSSEFLYVD